MYEQLASKNMCSLNNAQFMFIDFIMLEWGLRYATVLSVPECDAGTADRASRTNTPVTEPIKQMEF